MQANEYDRSMNHSFMNALWPTQSVCCALRTSHVSASRAVCRAAEVKKKENQLNGSLLWTRRYRGLFLPLRCCCCAAVLCAVYAVCCVLCAAISVFCVVACCVLAVLCATVGVGNIGSPGLAAIFLFRIVS